MKYFIIAGEASGDLHGSLLIEAIKKIDNNADFSCWGGDLMYQQGGKILKHYQQLNFMGFVELIKKLPQIFINIRQCKQDILNYNPDVIIFIDYPGFNLRMAKFCKKQGFKTVYYIAPKVWAWKENRIKILEQYIDKLLLILPFEEDYFNNFKTNHVYIGNPIAEAIFSFEPNVNFMKKNELTKPIVALLPGSRKQEIKKTLPIMINVAKNFEDYQFVIAGAPGVDINFYKPYLQQHVKIVFNDTYNLLSHATAAIVCSGTATLETALFNVPQVCGYIANSISVAIAKMFVKIKYISLVNLCLNKPAITEFIQSSFNNENISNELSLLLKPTSTLDMMQKDYNALKKLFQLKQGAATNAAKIIFDVAKNM